MKSSILFAIASLVSMQVHAAEDVLSVTIETIYTYDTYAVVQFLPAQTNSLGCKDNQVHIDMTNDKGRAIYSSVLTAATAGKLVSFRGTSCGEFNALTIYRSKVDF